MDPRDVAFLCTTTTPSSVTHLIGPRLLEFPQAFLDWRRSDGLIPGQPRVEEGYDDGGQWDGEPL